MAAQAYAITLKMPDGEKTIDVNGEHSKRLYSSITLHGFRFALSSNNCLYKEFEEQ